MLKVYCYNMTTHGMKNTVMPPKYMYVMKNYSISATIHVTLYHYDVMGGKRRHLMEKIHENVHENVHVLCSHVNFKHKTTKHA